MLLIPRRDVILANDRGLQQLLRDVVGTPLFRAILVYDVSRWGRFQDTDESAHYEFLCKAAGVPVHYCAESFANDGTLSSLLMKTLKRGMAAEYSRELSVKVLAGQKRLACLGYKQGGVPGYGLRRMLVASDGTPKQLLANGERKSIATDRVTLVHGPEHLRPFSRVPRRPSHCPAPDCRTPSENPSTNGNRSTAPSLPVSIASSVPCF